MGNKKMENAKRFLSGHKKHQMIFYFKIRISTKLIYLFKHNKRKKITK